MRCLTLLLLSGLAQAATSYTWGTKLRLDNGAASIVAVHTRDGVEQNHRVKLALPLQGAAYQKVTLWPVRYYSAKNEASCASPCEIALPLHYGAVKLRAEYFNVSGEKLRESQWYEIPQAPLAVETSYTMPLEVIGFAPYSRRVAVTLSAGTDVSQALRLYAKTHRIGYPTKARVRVNQGPWQTITAQNVTRLGHTANWQVGSLQFGQSILEWTLPQSAGILTAGVNEVEWQYWRENAQEESGYRVLAFNFLGPDRIVSSVSVSGSTVTVTAPNHAFFTGDDVRVEAFPGAAWRVNGVQRNIEVIDANTFRFTITAADGKRNGSWTYAGVKAARLAVDADSFTAENPATWSAPADASASNGAIRWAANDLLAPAHPGQTISASCADCHAHDGRDLKYFSYSNWSIQVRSMFHGLSESDSADIAAFIRSHNSPAPGRPYNPVYQPCPAATSVDAYLWSGACSHEDVLPHNMGMYEQLFGDQPDSEDFSPLRDEPHFNNTRIPLQLLDWNDWLPRVHPKDYWNSSINQANHPLGYWPTSRQKTSYDAVRNWLVGYCPGAGCGSRIQDAMAGGIFTHLNLMSGKWMGNYQVLNSKPMCEGSPADASCEGNLKTEQNQFSTSVYSAGLWTMTKHWEFAHEFDLERYGRSHWYGITQTDRAMPSVAPFQSSFNLMKAWGDGGTIPGAFDGQVATEKIVSMIWYQLQGILNRDTNQCCQAGVSYFDSITPIDAPYTYGYFKDLGNYNIWLPFMEVQWIQQNFSRHRMNYPNNPSGHPWYQNAIQPQMLTGFSFWGNWRGVPVEDRSALRAQIVDASLKKWSAIACGDESNGGAPLFTGTMWNGYINSWGASWRMPFKLNVAISDALQIIPSFFWHSLLYGKAYGANATTLDRIASCAAERWTGPGSTLASTITAGQTTIPLNNNYGSDIWPTTPHQVTIGSERINCSSRTGATLTGCTRGVEGTPPAAASSGTAVQIRIRWEAARQTNACFVLGDTFSVSSSCQDVDP